MLNTVQESTVPDNAPPVFNRKKYTSARSTVQRLIDKSARLKRPVSEFINVTPELAAVLLNHNPPEENRKLSPRTVSKYAQDMLSGNWQSLNGQTIVVSKDGFLNDGQHRLSALIQADTEMLFNLVFGAERNSRLTLDQNKVRTSGDYLHMQGIADPNNVAAVAVYLLAYERKGFNRNPTRRSAGMNSDTAVTKSDIHQYAVDHLDAIHASLAVAQKGDNKLLAPRSRLAAAHRIIVRKAKNADRVAEFFNQILFGEGLKRGDPAMSARSRLMFQRAEMPVVAVTIEVIVRAWNAFAKGEKLQRLVVKNSIPAVEG